ncbi:MAG: hypothetical protein LBE76_04850 [Nitrososphaerota archaeon]|jgi:hypothetical protein|nr:hypothetical protein [Nitrososphaerota archaeon]
MLDNVDIKKDITTITAENIKLVVENYAVGEQSYTLYTWTYVFKGVDYDSLAVRFNKFGQLCSVEDSRLLFTINDTSINISLEQAVDIAIENLVVFDISLGMR